jgi:simple sugar transport system ATP-binding protein
MSTVVEMKQITKIYPNGVVANDGVDFVVQKGEIHALIGENGAGKSTLMNILYGLFPPTSGELIINGKHQRFTSPRDAIAAGVGMIHQHFMLIPSFTVAQNVVLGFEPKKKGFVDEAAASEITSQLSQQYGLKVTPNTLVRDISVGMQQRVEILKLLYQGADILILDEPTAVLTPQETKDLFVSVRQLVNMGKTVIFITHKLNEVQEVSERFTVMRRGKLVMAKETKGVSREQMASYMVGREVFLQTKKPPCIPRDEVLKVSNLSMQDSQGITRLRDISFSIRAGEIVGIAGVEGNGQTELVEIISGLREASSGSVKILDTELLGKNPRQIRNSGLGHIPEDRTANGYAAKVTIEENLIIDRYWRPPFSRHMQLDQDVITKNAKRMIEQFDIRVQDGKQLAGECSGGNVQKVIIARELTSDVVLLIASQPTRGVDVGATEYIRDLIVKQRTAGMAVLLVSADLSEVINLSDRILTLFEGEITGNFENNPPISEEEVGLYMLGIKRQQGVEING